jgi:GH15 family glucan-1,4-alpha-glucosidase
VRQTGWVALAIEDYALIGDCHTAALVGNNGSIDWLCMPRFDSASVFGGLLGTDHHGHWTLEPAETVISTSRSYVTDTFVLVTRWVTENGEVEVTETMPHGDRRADLIRRVRGVTGTVTMRQALRIRFDYASALPWIRQLDDNSGLVAIAGPDAMVYRGPHLAANDHVHVGEFTVSPGHQVDLVLTWFPSHREAPGPIDVNERIDATTAWWQDWASSARSPLEYGEAVRRSLLVLRALTHEDTSGIVAAATTSLPEHFGGERNWDYRYVWLRDASLTLMALLSHGYKTEADGWRSWLLRAVAGDPDDVQIMYGLAGERSLHESELDSLPGYKGASPVRIGNEAWTQYQGDVFGEVMVALRQAREIGLDETAFSWPLQVSLVGFVERNWERPDNGIWEIRGRRRHFTHSRVMLWAALDCAIEGVREFGLPGPVDRWEALRSTIADEIETKGFNTKRNTYVQSYGSNRVDASLLQLAHVGYLAYDDPRMLGTVAALEKDLMDDGLLLRYRTTESLDGLPPGEHHFLACSFWLVEQYAHTGRLDDARRLMDRLVSFSNDVGLLSEEYDVREGRQVGNTPQALSHLALVRAADAIARSA